MTNETQMRQIGTMVLSNDGFNTRVGQVADIETNQWGTFHVVLVNGEFDLVDTISDAGYSGIGWKAATAAEINRHAK